MNLKTTVAALPRFLALPLILALSGCLSEAACQTDRDCSNAARCHDTTKICVASYELFELLPTPPAYLRRGLTLPMKVSIRRPDRVQIPIELTLSRLPEGMISTGATMNPGETSVDIPVDVHLGAALKTSTVQLTAVAGAMSDTQSVQIIVLESGGGYWNQMTWDQWLWN